MGHDRIRLYSPTVVRFYSQRLGRLLTESEESAYLSSTRSDRGDVIIVGQEQLHELAAASRPVRRPAPRTRTPRR